MIIPVAQGMYSGFMLSWMTLFRNVQVEIKAVVLLKVQVFWGVTLHCWESGSRHLLTLKLMVLRSSKPQALPCSVPAGHPRRLWVFIVSEPIQLTYSYLVVPHTPYSDSWSQAVNTTKSEPFSFSLNCVLCMPSTVYNQERYYDLL